VHRDSQNPSRVGFDCSERIGVGTQVLGFGIAPSQTHDTQPDWRGHGYLRLRLRGVLREPTRTAVQFKSWKGLVQEH
jgi:hypothetical protein